MLKPKKVRKSCKVLAVRMTRRRTAGGISICVLHEAGGDFQGRVTDYLKTLEISSETHAFLCGNCDMIYDAFDLLQNKGLPTAQIHTEVYCEAWV